MFERYTISKSAEELVEELKIEVPDRYAPRFNAGPSGLLPVITNESPQGLSFFYWGLPPSMAKNKPIGSRLINAPVEDISTKPSYRNALQTRRCLVPADGLYFWKKVSKKGKVPYRLIQNNESVFFLAAIWDEFDQDGQIIHTFNVLTVPSSETVLDFSPTMPAMLSADKGLEWLKKSSFEETDFSDSPLATFGSYPVSSRINNLELDQAELIKQSSPMDQFGNYSLFD